MVPEEAAVRAAEPIVREFRLALKGLRDSVRGVPDAEWTRAEQPGDSFPRQACHLLLALEAYLDGHRVKLGRRYGVPVESFHRSVVRFPSRQQVLEQIAEVDAKVEGWVLRFARRAMAGGPKRHNPLNVVVYTLRHTVVHLAYLRREMYQRGIRRPRY
jgi:hypothetical protein